MKTSLQGFRPALTQTVLCRYRRWLEAGNWDLERRDIVLSVLAKNKGADQLCSYFEADLRLCFRIGKNMCFLMTWLIKYNSKMIRLKINRLCLTIFKIIIWVLRIEDDVSDKC